MEQHLAVSGVSQLEYRRVPATDYLSNPRDPGTRRSIRDDGAGGGNPEPEWRAGGGAGAGGVPALSAAGSARVGDGGDYKIRATHTAGMRQMSTVMARKRSCIWRSGS